MVHISPGCVFPLYIFLQPLLRVPYLPFCPDDFMETTLVRNAKALTAQGPCGTLNEDIQRRHVWSALDGERDCLVCVIAPHVCVFSSTQREREREKDRLHSDALALKVTKKNVFVLILHLTAAISTPTQLLHWQQQRTHTGMHYAHRAMQRAATEWLQVFGFDKGPFL